MQTKKVFLSLIIGALFIAGLFLFLVKYRQPQAGEVPLKPSHLDFGNSNEIQNDTGSILGSPTSEPRELPNDPVPAPSSLSQAEQKLWNNFEEILASRNDNDPRVGDLKNLSPEFRKSLFERYNSLKPEDRNGRGFIVFLVVKDIRSASDLEFLQKVYQEQPCFSLENCAGGVADEDPHTAGVNQTTLSYPQLAGLYQLEKQLETNPGLLKDPSLRAGVLATLKQAEAFPVPVIRQRAEQIRNKFRL